MGCARNRCRSADLDHDVTLGLDDAPDFHGIHGAFVEQRGLKHEMLHNQILRNCNAIDRWEMGARKTAPEPAEMTVGPQN